MIDFSISLVGCDIAVVTDRMADIGYMFHDKKCQKTRLVATFEESGYKFSYSELIPTIFTAIVCIDEVRMPIVEAYLTSCISLEEMMDIVDYVTHV